LFVVGCWLEICENLWNLRIEKVEKPVCSAHPMTFVQIRV